MPQPNNPHAAAAAAYGDNAQKTTADPRELEARVLLKSNRMMKDLVADWDNRNAEILEKTINYNRQIWMLFYDEAVENPDSGHTSEIRSNIVNLANFIFKRGIDILTKPEKEKFNALININSEIAAGLMASVKNAQQSDTD